MKPLCACCSKVLSEPYIKCCDCDPGVSVCPKCFSRGREFGEHASDHRYEVKKYDFPVLESDWTGAEELALLDALGDCGFGNWSEISKFVRSKSKEECEEHYLQYYVYNHPPDFPEMANIGVVRWYRPLPFKASEDPPRPNADSDLSADLSGYMCCREEFSIEYDDYAEADINDIEFSPDDDELSSSLKLAVVDIFLSKLRQRHLRKRMVRRYGLLDLRKRQAIGYTYGRKERLLRENLEVFARLLSPEDFEMLVVGLLEEDTLRQQTRLLRQYREAGLKSRREAIIYERLRKRRKEAQSRRGCLDELLNSCEDPVSCQIWLQRHCLGVVKNLPSLPLLGRKQSAPLDLSGTPGVEHLTDEERELCSSLRILPEPYIGYKNTLIKECSRQGYLQLRQARPLIKIDVNKTRKLFDFFVDKGWIKKDTV